MISVKGILMDRATVTEFQQADGVRDWRALDAGASAWFDAPSMTAGAALVRRIGELTAATGLPDVDLRPGGVRVRIGPARDRTRDDVELARSISAAAQDLGLAADPAVLANRPSLVSFWQDRARLRARPGRQRSAHRHAPPGVDGSPTALVNGYRFAVNVAPSGGRDHFARSAKCRRKLPVRHVGSARPLSRPTHGEHHDHVSASAACRVAWLFRTVAALGATEERYDFWVLRDPWDNEFCVLQPEFPELPARRRSWTQAGSCPQNMMTASP